MPIYWEDKINSLLESKLLLIQTMLIAIYWEDKIKILLDLQVDRINNFCENMEECRFLYKQFMEQGL